MIGNVVGKTHEAVERQDRGPVARRDEKGRDGEILVVMTLAGLERVRLTHARSLALEAEAWTRPFHIPPFPDQC